MINKLEYINLALLLIMCIACSRSDLKEGIIYNKVLGIFFVLAICLDSIYYGFFERDLFLSFIINFAMIALASLILFYTHSFAGGDCKMAIVLALLYPAGCYFMYKNSCETLIFAMGISIFAGYCYLLVNSIFAIISKKKNITYEYIRNYVFNFLKSYICAYIYISMFNCIIIFLNENKIAIDIWVVRALAVMVAWIVGRYSIFKKKISVVSTLILMGIISFKINIIPFTLNLESYFLVFFLMICQMVIKNNIYENIEVKNLKKGMILSRFSSILMQNSITKGLPQISTEDLKSRLTSEEIESIHIWPKATHTEKLTIIKQIPFAIFISIGFISYFIIWSVLV